MKHTITALLLALTLMFSACSNDKPVQTAPAYSENYEQPQEVHHYNHDSGGTALLTGVLVGSMLSNSGGSSSTHTTVNRTYVSGTPSTAHTPIATTATSTKPKYRGSKVKPVYSSTVKPKYRSPTVKKSYTSSYKKPRYRSSSKKRR